MQTDICRTYAIVISLLITPLLTTHAQPVNSIFSYLTKKDTALITLDLDLTLLAQEKRANTYFPGKIWLENGQEISTQVRPRGKFRRRISEIPPLKLKFSKKELKALQLDTLNEIKLVLPQTFDDEGVNLLLKEYLAYRMYEKISPYHVKARLIRLNLSDKSNRTTKPTTWAILLEHEEELQVRLKGPLQPQFGIPVDSLDSYYAALNAAFQFMIGNTDWSIPDQRNILLFKNAANGKMIPIPYDFDFSGLVDAPYATPTKESGLNTVRDRALLAEGLNKRAIKQAIKILLEHEAFFMGCCQRAHLEQKQIKLTQQYLANFFSAVRQYHEVPQRINANS